MKTIKCLVFADLHETNKEHIVEILKKEYDCIFLLGDINNFYLKIIKEYSIVDEKNIFGVVGNHDKWNDLMQMGIQDVHLKTNTYKNISIGGFCGCVEYKDNLSTPQFSQLQSFALLDNMESVNIFLSHTSPFGIHENHDVGFSGIMNYIESKNPNYVFHGHQHINKKTTIKDTIVFGVFGCQIIEIKIEG